MDGGLQVHIVIMESVIFSAGVIYLQHHVFHLGKVLNQPLLYTLVIGLVVAQSAKTLSQLMYFGHPGLDLTVDAVQFLGHPSQPFLTFIQLILHTGQSGKLILRRLLLEGSSFGF